ncbi:MAG: RHS repeat-associated core domain-containing protein, partial [Halieaceae bacterium]|nr:RHS repeat-associated core domain-containing protein [Halieaceae bacterium]
DYNYDAQGNMLHKSDVGNYAYGDQSRSTGNAGPHALLSAGPDHTGYQYDANGNMLQGGGRNITWSSFNKPTEFRKDGTLKASFQYGPDRSRYLKVTPASRTLYLGKAYERIETGDKVEHKHFVYADGQLVAIHVKTTANAVAQPDTTRYLHRDSLGSIDTITDGQGNIVDRMSYEPFGARRGGDWRVGIEALVIPALTNRGFTGHEHVDEMDLIHMNGRVYDPQLGRFLSADPHVQAPGNSQSYNRYSYVINNPLKYTDPSGYFFGKIFKAIKKIFKKVVSAIKKYIRPIIQIAAAYFGGPLGAAIA